MGVTASKKVDYKIVKKDFLSILADPNSYYEEHPDPNLKNLVLVPKKTSFVYGLGDVWKKMDDGTWLKVQEAESFSDTHDFDEYVNEFCHKRDGHYVYGVTWLPPPKDTGLL